MTLQQIDVKSLEQDVKSGLGLYDGVVSELAVFFTVWAGHAERLREAVKKFNDRLRSMTAEDTMKTGLRDSRHVLFDNDTRLLWCTTFETDWHPHFDDALLIVSIEPFFDWMQHTVEGKAILEWYEEQGGAAAFDRSAPDFEERARHMTTRLREIFQGQQCPASGYFNLIGSYHIGLTQPEIQRNMRLRQAFDKVLDDPDAEQALQHPALKPLLEYAAE